MPEINITNEVKARINTKKLKKTIEYLLVKLKKKNREVSLVITGDKTIKKWNKTYRKKNSPTDILAFPGEGNFLGEILIDLEQIKRQAGQFNHTAYQEFIFILIHGFLHLVGHDDDTEKNKQAMIELGNKYYNELKTAGLV
jgi:probable rRNA maturation factor